TLLHLQDVARDLLEPLRDRVAVNRPERDDLENEHVERALEQVGFRRLRRHTVTVYISICRMSRCPGTRARRPGVRWVHGCPIAPVAGCHPLRARAVFRTRGRSERASR